MSVLLSLWRLLDERQRRRLAGLQFLSIIMGLSTVGGIAAVLPFFTALADPAALKHTALLRFALERVHLTDEGSLVIALGVAFSGVVLIANLVNLLGFLAINRFASRVGETLYVRLFDAYMHRDYQFHTLHNSSVLTTRVLHETARVTSGVLQQGLVLVTNLVTIVCIAASMLLVNSVVALATVAGFGATYAAIYALVRKRLLRNGEIESACDAARTRTVNESFGAIREITLMQARAAFVTRFAQQCRSISAATANTLAISQSPRYILECITVFCLVSIALYLHSHPGGGGPWIAQLSFMGFAAYRLLPALQQSFAAVVRIRADSPAFSTLAADLGRPPLARGALPAPAPDALPERAWRGRPRSEIRLCNVSFRYAPELPDVVSAVSLTIPAGALVGLVGPNGSGKTTLIDVLSGLLVPQSGHIEIDGAPLEQSACAAWQSTIAYVPQQVFLFDATLAENIACGIPTSEIDYARLDVAVRQAHLTECVRSLPEGYQQIVGERGCRLSGGQRQRLAIARALYRDASLLILDEVTSSLDTATESEIIDTLHGLRPDKTVLMIAHRPGALRRCDLVFELRHGRLVEHPERGGQAPGPARSERHASGRM
jgi:ATP-binding cassette, subfamily B, bacterial PglK